MSTWLLTLLLALPVLADRAADLAAPAGETAPSADDAPPTERLRARLRAKPREERLRLERNLAEFERLPRAARARVLESARVLRERERALLAAPAGPADAVAAPAQRIAERGAERSEISRAELRERFRERGREVRGRLPAELRERLERSPPAVRRAVLERLIQRREQVSQRALEDLRVRLHLSQEEVERLASLPLGERLQALRELVRRARATIPR